jgi:superfamily II DNA or RNA helicase
MEIVDNRILLLNTRSPSKYEILPKHKVFPIPGGYQVAVHWGLDEVRVLRNLGVRNAPSPILGRYDWPGRYMPMSHQRDTASFLTLNRRAFVLSEPGTGKTMSALWAADYLMRRGEVRRCLILCPLSIMHSAWMQDISNSVIHRTAVVAHHAQAMRRVEIVQQEYEFVISNYEGLDLIAKEIKNDGRFDLVIVDEANAYKNPSTRRWKALASILTPHTYLWMMTGTPASQSPLDAYGLAKLVNPDGVPKFFTAWRDEVMNKITMFKWAPKATAAERVHRALQPAIRFTKAQCMDLPPVITLTREVPLTAQQAKYYNLLKTQMLVQAAGETITAVNAAAALNKLLQISCIAYNTPVLTHSGWVPIQAVRDTDLVWDGVEFVKHEGLVARGRKRTIDCFGVRMTPDHEVFTDVGWRTAEESAGLDRADVRLPYSAVTTRYERWENQEGPLALSLLLRQGSSAREPVPSHEAPHDSQTLRMSARQQNAQYDEHTPLQNMGGNAKTLLRSYKQRLAALWWAGRTSKHRLAKQLRKFLERHGAYLRRALDFGSYRQQRPLFARKLPVGYGTTAVEQYAEQCLARHAERAHDAGSSGKSVRPSRSNTCCTAGQIQVAAGKGADYAGEEDVFDISQCGPRNQFVVMGRCGTPLIVHNCGVAYTDNQETVEFDATPRLNVLLEALEQTERKVIIFALFRATIDAISAFLNKSGTPCEEIHGGVTATKRGDIIRRFQTQPEPRVLVMQPQAAAHGITLTAADTVIFYGPLMSVEQYTQAIARADRKGQDSDKVTVIHIEGSPVEKKMFKALAEKVDDARMVVQLFEAEIKEGGLQNSKKSL